MSIHTSQYNDIKDDESLMRLSHRVECMYTHSCGRVPAAQRDQVFGGGSDHQKGVTDIPQMQQERLYGTAKTGK